MEVKHALLGQLRAGLAMLRQCIEVCPEDVWAAANEHPRTYWRIAYHALFYTHFYLMPDQDSFVPWAKHQNQAVILWNDDEDGVPPDETTYSQADLLDYMILVEAEVERWLDALDLESPESGFPWYEIPKLDHQLVNLRHLGIHVGQLQERLFAVGIDTDWVGRR